MGQQTGLPSPLHVFRKWWLGLCLQNAFFGWWCTAKQQKAQNKKKGAYNLRVSWWCWQLENIVLMGKWSKSGPILLKDWNAIFKGPFCYSKNASAENWPGVLWVEHATWCKKSFFLLLNALAGDICINKLKSKSQECNGKCSLASYRLRSSWLSTAQISSCRLDGLF